jgi:alpha-N-arabinofuranosidase
MKRVFLLLVTLFGLLSVQAQGYRNPVLPGFHADPSVCTNGEDFYLVNSTFQYFPGVPVFHSRDLIHWEQIGNCLTRKTQLDLSGLYEQENAQSGWTNGGIYAPTIRYHEGRYYMVTTVFPSRRHFYVWTDDPAKEWSDPVLIDFAIGSCDPTLFWDEDRCYFVWKAAADETRPGIQPGVINICEIDVNTGKRIGNIHHLGTGLGGRYPEGPHIYKKDGYYYMMLAEGGTEHGHHVNILRSESLFGPYEPNPANPILTHFSMRMQNSNIQGLGHADLVQAPDSSWWMICLGYRTSGYLLHVMGRETMLAPVRWDENAWPVVNGNGTIAIDMKCRTLPQVQMPQEPTREEFGYIKRDVPAESYSSIGLPWGWMSIGNPDYACYSLTQRDGWLRLHPTSITLDAATSPTLVARRQTELHFIASALIDASHLEEGSQAGITAYAAPLNHYDVVVERRNGRLYARSNIRLGALSHTGQNNELKGSLAYIRISSDKEYYYMQVSDDGKAFSTLGKMDFRYLSTEVIGGFTGVMLGLFAQGDNDEGYADFDWFEYTTE